MSTEQPTPIFDTEAPLRVNRALHTKQAQEMEFTLWEDGSLSIEH